VRERGSPCHTGRPDWAGHVVHGVTGVPLGRIVVLALVVTVACGSVLPRLGTFLAVSDSPGPADVVLVTYGINSFARPVARTDALHAAAARYTRGEVSAILLGELTNPEQGFSTRVELSQAVLVKAGVPERDIVVLPAVESEYGEAEALRAEVTQRGWKRVVAYAPDFRVRRTRGALRQATRTAGTDVRVISVSDPTVDLARWWQSADTAALVLNEYPRWLYYLARRWL